MSAGLSAGAIGTLLGVSADTVRRHHGEWTRTRGFPRPLFDDGMLRWDGEAVVAWKQRASRPADEPAGIETDWAAIARRRGAALDAGADPDLS
ncbi:hypothetical protein [Reyranella sp.]|uniref:hypothetical protein n=1 Tax=Reyranella sp. TaxID=1929291 RepID=UPI003D0E1F67